MTQGRETIKSLPPFYAQKFASLAETSTFVSVMTKGCPSVG